MLRRIAVLLVAGFSTMCPALAATTICNSLTEDVRIAFNVLRKGGSEETFGWNVVEAKKCRSFSDLGTEDAFFMFSTRPSVRFEGTGYRKNPNKPNPQVLCLEEGDSSFVIVGKAAHPHLRWDHNCMSGQKAYFFWAKAGKTIRLYPEAVE